MRIECLGAVGLGGRVQSSGRLGAVIAQQGQVAGRLTAAALGARAKTTVGGRNSIGRIINERRD